MPGSFDVNACRRQFPAFERELVGRPAVFFDGPAGSQVPRRVVDAVAKYLAETNANHGGVFATSRESDAVLAAARRAVADLLGSADADLVAFGPNMTTLTFALSQALRHRWRAGDEVIVTHLDHDANFTPWVLAARDAGATVRRAPIRPEDCTLDLEALRSLISTRTKLVAVTAASNAVGTLTPVDEIVRLAHEVGAQVFVDAVHFAPHARIDVDSWDCDYLACSAYKFFGPHVGILWGKRALLEELPAYKVRPASDALPDRWMNGTQNHEGIAGAAAAIDYLEELGRACAPDTTDRRSALDAAYAAIGEYERGLASHLIEALEALPGVSIRGIRDVSRLAERVPTVSITHASRSPSELAEILARDGIFTWHGNFYALPLTEALGLEPDGLLRIGLLHYNTHAEVDRLAAALAAA